ncbi:MAG: GNAT family N-acetyltransferase [Flavobacteriaceae bacterium]
MVNIIRASTSHLEDVVPLFDQYRVFYEQPSNEAAAKLFLNDRLQNDECIIYLAQINGASVGFILLYTSFSSVSMLPIFILNDLFVSDHYRNQGIGELLLNKAKEVCRGKNYKGLALETATDNPAQKLYEKLGWVKDTHCFHYFWTAV